MRKPLLVVMTAILICSTLLGPYEIAQGNHEVQSTGTEDWPMFRHDPEHTGFSSSGAPIDNKTTILRWSNTTDGIIEYSSPAVFGDWLFIGTLSGSVYAFNSTSGHLKWSKGLGGKIESSPAAGNGRVFVGSTNGRVYALNMTTGYVLWNLTIGDEVYSSPTLANGIVYVASYNRTVYALHENGTVKWKNNSTLGGSCKSSPAVAEGKLYIGASDRRVYALDAESGAKDWNSTDLGGQIVESSPAVSNGKIFVGVVNNNILYALHQANGSIAWPGPTTGHIRSSPAVADGKVFVGAEDGRIYAFDENTGNQVWNFSTGGAVGSSPAVANGAVFVGSANGKIYALNASTGNELWSRQTNGEIWSSPAVANGWVFVGSKNRNVYAFAGNNLPTADFEYYPSVAEVNQTVTFNASKSYDPDLDPIIEYWWDFGDGTPPCSTDKHDITHEYRVGGTHFVKLVVTDSYQAKSSPKIKPVLVMKHEYAIEQVWPQEVNVTKGDVLNIYVNVTNTGDYYENLTVTAWCSNATYPPPGIPIDDPKNISLPAKQNQVVEFQWNTVNFTGGFYHISATADGIMKEDGNVEILIHDLAIRNIYVHQTEVQVNQTIPIDIEIWNEGSFTEYNINLTVFANETCVGTKSTTALLKWAAWIPRVEWNTTGFLGNYTLAASVTMDDPDSNAENNNLTDGTVLVRLPFHDVAVLEVLPSRYNLTRGEVLNVTVSLKNQGEYQSENATVTLWYSDSETPKNTTTMNVTLEKCKAENVTLSWNTTAISGGHYLVGACVCIKDDDRYPSNNNNEADEYVTVLIEIRDVQVADVKPQKPTAFKGRPMQINITFENLGNYTMEVFIAHAYENGSLYQSYTVPGLGPGEQQIWSLEWEPSDVGSWNITIHAEISDENRTNNIKTKMIAALEAVSDIAVNWVGVVPYVSQVPCGRNVTVMAEVQNKGAWPEDFTVGVYANQTSIGNITLIGQRSVHLEYCSYPKNESFIWITRLFAPESYTIFANVTILPDEEGNPRKNDNYREDGTVLLTPGFNDVAIIGMIWPTPLNKTIIPLSPWPSPELTVNFTATIWNKGTFTEDIVIVTAYLVNTTLVTPPVGQRNETNLLPGEIRSVTVAIRVWNNSGIQKGNYRIRVNVYIPNDANPGDNTQDSFMSWKVVMTGDISGVEVGVPDNKVDTRDIALVAKYFGHITPPELPICDINNDGKIDIKDIAIVAREFGKIDP